LENIILKEYNLNIINLNSILRNKIEIDITNFIYLYNLEVSLKSKDTKKIILHFLLQEILNYINSEYNNIIVIRNDYKCNHLDYWDNSEECNILLHNIIKIIANKLDLPIICIESTLIIDKDFIYRMKNIAENKSKNIIPRMSKFLQRNDLTKLSENLKKDPSIKLKLYRI
jgi:hypothetical protein